MPIRFSELVKRDELKIKDRPALTKFYESIRDALIDGLLTREGETITIKLSNLVTVQRGDIELSDYSLKEDEHLEEFLQLYIAKARGLGQATVTYSAKGKITEPLYHELNRAYKVLQSSTATKDELRKTLDRLLTVYTATQLKLKSPPIQGMPLPPEAPEYASYDKDRVMYDPHEGFVYREGINQKSTNKPKRLTPKS